MPYDTDTVAPCCCSTLPTDEARVIAHATPTTLSACTSLSTYPYPLLLSPTPLLARTVCFSRFVCSRSLALSVNLISFNALGLFAQLAAAMAAGGRRWKEVVRGRGSGNGSRGQHQRRLRQRFLLLNAKNTKNSETKHAAAALH